MSFDNVVTKNKKLDYFELENKPSEKGLQEYYARKYYQDSVPKNYSQVYSENELKLIKQKLEQRYAAIVESKKTAEFKSFLDVGCGEGFSLKFFVERGFSVKGLDFSCDGVQKQNPDCIDYFQAGDVFHSLTREIELGHKYDIVWLQNVLEHVLDPQELLKELQSLVSDQGVLVVTVPNDFSKLQKQALDLGIVERPFWVVSPDHISYFNTNNIMNVVKQSGWNVLDRLADFPIDWFIFNSSSNYIANPKSGKDAHIARLEIENLISENELDDINGLYRSLAKVGMGRNVTVILNL